MIVLIVYDTLLIVIVLFYTLRPEFNKLSYCRFLLIYVGYIFQYFQF